MADDRYGGYGRREGWREREGSIFSDDDDERRGRGSGRWTDEFGRERFAGREDDRGFFERAGDEVRSWFGDEEAERRREHDQQRDDARSAFGGPGFEGRYEATGRGTAYGMPGGYGASYGGNFTGPRDEVGRASLHRDLSRDEAGHDSRSFGRGGGRSHWDDNYRRWRDQQIRQFDQEYADYCRDRQQQFEQEFDSWRSSRLTEGGIARGAEGRTAPDTTRTAGTERETAGTAGEAGEAGEAGRGRGGRTRT